MVVFFCFFIYIFEKHFEKKFSCDLVYSFLLVHSMLNFSKQLKVFWYPKLICTANSRAFKTKYFDINLMKFCGLIRKLWIIKYEIWTAAILFSS